MAATFEIPAALRPVESTSELLGKPRRREYVRRSHTDLEPIRSERPVPSRKCACGCNLELPNTAGAQQAYIEGHRQRAQRKRARELHGRLWGQLAAIRRSRPVRRKAPAASKATPDVTRTTPGRAPSA